MSAKLVLTVKDSNRMAKDLSMSVMDKMFHPLKYNKMMNSKAKIGIFIDDEKEGTLYEASKTPYEISLINADAGGKLKIILYSQNH